MFLYEMELFICPDQEVVMGVVALKCLCDRILDNYPSPAKDMGKQAFC